MFLKVNPLCQLIAILLIFNFLQSCFKMGFDNPKLTITHNNLFHLLFWSSLCWTTILNSSHEMDFVSFDFCHQQANSFKWHSQCKHSFHKKWWSRQKLILSIKTTLESSKMIKSSCCSYNSEKLNVQYAWVSHQIQTGFIP